VKRILFTLSAVVTISVVSACRPPGPNGSMLSQGDQRAILAYSETETDNLMEGLNAGDYTVFSRDLSQDMLEALPQGEFEQWQKERAAKLGWYLRREVEGMVRRSDGTYTVIYQASFQFNDDVLMRVVFRADPPHKISGLSFDK
jgi:hypothetical protein